MSGHAAAAGEDVALTVPSSLGAAGRTAFASGLASRTGSRDTASLHRFALQLLIVFLAYFIAGKLGQETTNIRSGNLGPVWPASGVALAAVLAYGYRIWPALFASCFVVAFQSPVFPLTAAGQATGATLAAVAGAFLLRRVPDFDPALSRLRHALALIVLGAFASSMISATIGIASLFGTRLEAYSGVVSAWLIYWLGDATGVLLVTPLVFSLPMLFRIRSRRRLVELGVLLTLLTAACFVVFGDLPLLPIRLHVLAFAVLPFVMWAAINFGVAGASLTVVVVATSATLLTAFGHGPFSAHTPFVNAALLDVLFTVLSVSGLALAAVIAERERAEAQREQLVRAKAAAESRLRLAAIVESLHEAIISTTPDDVIVSWNAAAQRIFGFTEAEAAGQPASFLVPAELRSEHLEMLHRLRAGTPVGTYESIRMTKAGQRLHVSVTMSPIRDADGNLVAVARILRDITDAKRAEEALSTVSRRLIDAQEEERRRIARELHDHIGQRVALLAANLSDMPSEGRAERPLDADAAKLQRLAAEIATEVQALSHRLHSSRLDVLGLAAAAKQLCGEIADQQNASVAFENLGLPDPLPRDISLCLFRILQEALHNAAKYSGVQHFQVRFWYAHGDVHLLVRDQGQGFDVASARAGRGLGLISMEERIKLVNGRLSIDSRAGHGTTVHARVRCGAAGSEPPLQPDVAR
jgi:PAS domain S-box-containing protein